MSQENLELVRRLYEEAARGNYAAFRDSLDANVVYWLTPNDPEPGPYHGVSAAMRWIGHPADDGVLVRDHTEVREVVEVGEWVLAWVRVTGRGSASGATFDIEGAIVHRIAAGRIVEIREYATRSEALEAVGLGE